MSLQIKLPKLYYAAGEPVSGNVALTLKKARKFNYITITLYAYEHTEWQEAPEKLPPQQAQVHALTHRRRRRVLMNQTTRLFPSKATVDLKTVKELERGEYQWPFDFSIPDNFPPTMSYRDGRVRIIYKLKAIAAPKWSLNISTVQNFRVGLLFAIDPAIPPRVVEGNKSYLISTSLFKNKQKDAPVLIKAFLNREVGYSGDEVVAHIDIDNQSPKVLSSIKLKLKQDVSFGPRKERNTVWKKEVKVNIKEDSRWNSNFAINIPRLDLMPSVTNGGLISVKYSVAIHITAFAAKSLIVELPFIISIFPPLVPSAPVYAFPSAPAKSPGPTPQTSQSNVGYSYPAAPPYEPPTTTQVNMYPVTPLEEDPSTPPRSYTPPSPRHLERRMTYTPSVVTPPPDWSVPPTVSNVNKDVVQDTALVELDNAIYSIQSCLGDLESSVYYAQLNELDEVADFPVDQTKLHDLSQSQLLQTAKTLSTVAAEFVSEIQQAVKPDVNNNNAFPASQALSSGVQKLVYESKHTAILIGDSQSQICLLTACKAVAITCQQMLLAAKNLKYHVNDSEVKADERFQTAKDLLYKSFTAAQDGIQHLISTLQAAMKDTVLKLHALNNANNMLQNFMISFVNPFFEVPATNYDAVQQEAAVLSGTISSLITAYSVSQDQTVSLLQKLAEGVISFLTAIRGCFEVSENQYTTKDIIDAARYIVNNAGFFMETAVRMSGKVGEDHQAFNDVTSRLLSSVSSCASMVRPPQEPVNTTPPSSPVNVLAQLEDSLKTVESSHNELKALEPIQDLKALNLNNNNSEEKSDYFDIMDSEDENDAPTEQNLTACSKAIAESASNLLKIAIVTEKERETTVSLLSPFIVKESEKDTSSNPLYRSADSKKFMVGAAVNVAQSTQKLVNMIKTFEEERKKGNRTLELEPLEVCARNVASATALLVATSATFASATSRSKLSQTAKEIAYYSSNLVNTAKAVIVREEPEVEVSENTNDDQATETQAKLQMFEQQIKILKLEKELDKARSQLFQLRKKEYTEHDTKHTQ